MKRPKASFTLEDDFHAEMQRDVYEQPIAHVTNVTSVTNVAPTKHVNTIVFTVPCEALCRVPTTPTSSTKQGHSPMLKLDHAPRIIGCTCGWRTPPGTTDFDDAYVAHATVLR